MFAIVEKFQNAFKEIQRRLVEGTRYYVIEDEEVAYPSITSIISHVNRKKWADWQQKVGLEEANRVRKHSTNRGTKFHKLAEVYLQNGDIKSLDEYKDPLVQLMFNAAKSSMDDRLSNIVFQEKYMYSHQFGVAGACDLICDVDGELAIVDFKTAKAEKQLSWILLMQLRIEKRKFVLPAILLLSDLIFEALAFLYADNNLTFYHLFFTSYCREYIFCITFTLPIQQGKE